MKNQTANPKAKQFSEELQTLLAKYQYRLIPELDITKNGLVPVISIVDVLPPKGNGLPPATITPTVKKFSEEEIKDIDEKVKKLKKK